MLPLFIHSRKIAARKQMHGTYALLHAAVIDELGCHFACCLLAQGRANELKAGVTSANQLSFSRRSVDHAARNRSPSIPLLSCRTNFGGVALLTAPPGFSTSPATQRDPLAPTANRAHSAQLQ